ncbi:hypothetical protein TVAG_050820 [Trichomonas vaginalis G3]|uniref:Uncharacterized protein n=1 Tax=Trichomonas vaginalis (strain ATCC PRA-98 / G3) TaxID=412133 RepID=A2EEP1_TRIV3|nr:hypothetical protein TVAGG3_0981700 [Trichomonas vaginalis G3]EAY08847.1 hypothetical protein TVAG_050820 [Trichomonas vaginalis G3]KAI5489342.1 hypothetical protein TVAGG3_0981700 [Trichomonas vaginalis G3]|eukprot:XP_001321070.1 hypothetical protein [Trichomonas vaginalis G3]
MTEEITQISPSQEYYLDINSLSAMLQELKKGEMDINSSYYLKIVEYWCDYKWNSIVEAQLADLIHSVLFGTLIENYTKFEKIHYQIARTQVSFYFNVFSTWEGFTQWINETSESIQLMFYLALSRKFNNSSPLFSQNTASVKEHFISSGLKDQFLNKTFSQNQQNSPINFAILAALSKWIDTSFIFDENIKTVILSQMQNPETFPYILKLYSHAIMRIPQENILDFVNIYSNFEEIPNLLQKFNTAATQVAFAEYICYLFAICDNVETKNLFADYAKQISPNFPAAAPVLLQIFISLAKNPENALEMFSIGWTSLFNLASASDLNLSNIMNYQKSICDPENIAYTAYTVNNEEIFKVLSEEIYAEIDPVNQPQLALAQMNLIVRFVFNGKCTFKEMDDYLDKIFTLFAIEAAELVTSMPHLVLLWTIYELGGIYPLHFGKYRNQFVEKYLELISLEDLDQEILDKFEDVFLEYVKANNLNQITFNEEILGTVLSKMSITRICIAALFAMNMIDNELQIKIIEIILQAINDCDDQPHEIAKLLLKFISSFCDKISSEIQPKIKEIVAETEQFCEDDEINSLSMYVSYNLDANSYFETLPERFRLIQWIKSVDAMQSTLTGYIPPEDHREMFASLLLQSLEILIQIIQRIFECFIGGMVPEEEMVKVLRKFIPLLQRIKKTKNLHIEIPQEIAIELNNWVAKALQLAFNSFQVTRFLILLLKEIFIFDENLTNEYGKIIFSFVLSEEYSPLLNGIMVTQEASIEMILKMPIELIPTILSPFLAMIGCPDISEQVIGAKKLKNEKRFAAVHKIFQVLWKYAQVVPLN